MKGYYFKEKNEKKDIFLITSEPAVLNGGCGDEFCVTVMRVSDGWVNVVPVLSIEKVFASEEAARIEG